MSNFKNGIELLVTLQLALELMDEQTIGEIYKVFIIDK
jgi:hypothetical protein